MRKNRPESFKHHVEQILRQDHADRRIPVLVLLGATAQQACESLCEVPEAYLSKLFVFVNDMPSCAWPHSLRVSVLASDELANAQGCLCCSMRSELASAMSQLFLSLLRRQQDSVGAVVIVTQANDAHALVASLKHAPFLAQRFHFEASLLLTRA